MHHAKFLVCAGLLTAACAPKDGLEGWEELEAAPHSGVQDRWSSLLRPELLKVGGDGRIYVGDHGDMTIKIFTADGELVGKVGRLGRGPGEWMGIQDFAVLDTEVVVLDAAQLALIRVGLDGTPLGRIPLPDREGTVSAHGDSLLILANSPMWSVRALSGTDSMPLFTVIRRDGSTVTRYTARQVGEGPLSDYTMNYVLPVGSSGGQGVWLSWLNDSAIVFVPGGSAVEVSLSRTLPFIPRRVPPDEEIRRFMAGPRGVLAIYDQVSLSATTDQRGSLYVLTALGPAQDSLATPSRVGVDIVTIGRDMQRYLLPGHPTSITVSPAGDRLYALDSRSGTITAFDLPPSP